MVQTIENEIRAERHRAAVLRRAGGSRTIHAHSMVSDTAREMALVMYETVMSNNAVRTEWLRRHPGLSEIGLQSAFVQRYWRRHVGAARATLAAMLRQPSHSAMHDQIHEALLLDNMLVRGRGGVANGRK